MIKSAQTILLATGDSQLIKNLNSFFANSEYKFISASDVVEALYQAEKFNADVVVLDCEI